tara:strand:+ start:2589 stop:2765 length:177 start_codon:yes stop_codon:yes gene_type:complete
MTDNPYFSDNGYRWPVFDKFALAMSAASDGGGSGGCEMGTLKIRLETEEWIYEEYEIN